MAHEDAEPHADGAEESSAPPLEHEALITVEPSGDGSVVRLVGDIDGALRDQASLAMAEVLRRGGPVVVDLAGVTFIDSSGLAFVLQLHRLSVDDPGQPCVLRNPPSLVLDLLEMIGVLGDVRLEFTSGGDMPVLAPATA